VFSLEVNGVVLQNKDLDDYIRNYGSSVLTNVVLNPIYTGSSRNMSTLETLLKEVQDSSPNLPNLPHEIPEAEQTPKAASTSQQSKKTSLEYVDYLKIAFVEMMAARLAK
jgi:hypothetical protein